LLPIPPQRSTSPATALRDPKIGYGVGVGQAPGETSTMGAGEPEIPPEMALIVAHPGPVEK